MSKIERISAILVKLQSCKFITAQQIADQFGVCLRTIYRDLRVLEEAGVPIVSNMGIGYSLTDGYKLPPLMFTAEEAIAFLMAEKVLGLQSGADAYELYRNGMDKIRAVLKAVEKNILEDFDSHIQVVDMLSPPPTQPLHVLQPLLGSITQKKAVEIHYALHYDMKTTVREVEPIGIFYMFQNWYLLAWCKMKGDYRTFHLGRIKSVRRLEEEFVKSHRSLKIILKSLYPNNTRNHHHVKIKLSKIAVRDMGVGKYLHGLSVEKITEDFVIQGYVVSSLEYFGRWYLSFADQAEIIEPMELKNVVQELISKIKL